MASEALRILLIEDSGAEAELIVEMLTASRRDSFQVQRVERLAAGIERLAAGRYDAILLDFTLPDSSGLETYLRVREKAPRVPVIILTNLDDEGVASHAVREGAQDYLVKREVDSALLSRAIRYAVERQRAEDALAISEERYALAVRGANDGIWDWDPRTGTAYYSSRWHEILGCAPGELGSTIEDWLSRAHPDDETGLRQALAAHLSGAGPHFEHEHRLRDRNGDYLWVLARGCAVRDGGGAVSRVAGSLTDVTPRKRAEERLVHDALHDTLTQLPNRTLFLDRLGLALERSRRRRPAQFAVLFMDLDRFKNLNDSLGHTAGDALLVEFAGRLVSCLRPGDTVARLGGDEFGILLADVNAAEDAIRVAERIKDVLLERFVLDRNEVVLSASIGIAIGAASYSRPEDVLRDADTAMYRAKAAGRACYQVFDQAMHRSVAALLKLEMDLRRAVQLDQFVMHYQPIIALAPGRIVGFEGLVRWIHPERGMIYPQRFIAVAEETGLIVPIGWWVLRETCRQIKEWQGLVPMNPPLYASANVSGKLFTQPDMVERLWRLLEETGLDPASLRLEITENILMEHDETALQVLSQLRALGVQFSVDDFGTGYSSLSYLQRFAYDTLKIDRSFIAGMEQKADVGAIVQTIVGLASTLGMNVIAEGVETPLQLERLRAMNCPAAQGFWFSEPVGREAAQRLLLDGQAW